MHPTRRNARGGGGVTLHAAVNGGTNFRWVDGGRWDLRLDRCRVEIPRRLLRDGGLKNSRTAVPCFFFRGSRGCVLDIGAAGTSGGGPLAVPLPDGRQPGLQRLHSDPSTLSDPLEVPLLLCDLDSRGSGKRMNE